jgi:hypothetical protein
VRSLSRSEAEEWCRRRGIPVDRGPTPPAARASLPIPVDAGQRVALVRDQVAAFEGESEVLVWFTEWGVWPSAERPHIFDRLRASYGERRPLIEIPAHLFLPSEAEDLLSFVTLGVLFLWDVNVIGASSSRMLLFSHDEMVDVVGVSL